MALLLAVPAFADGRGPAFTSYDVVCPKETLYYQENWDKDGVMEKKGAVPAGTVLTVSYEYERDGVMYGNVQIGQDEDADWGFIRLSEVQMKNEEYLPENAQKLSRPHSVRVIGRGGIPMYAGPNKKFEKVATVPRGTKLTYNYGNDEEDDYRTWAYVTYLGRSGWIYVYASDTKNGVAELPDTDKAEIWVLEDGVQMFDGISFGNIESEISDNLDGEYIKELHEEPDRVVGTLEKGKKYSYRYSHGQDFGVWYYVTAGLRTGWVFMSHGISRIAVTTAEVDQGQYMAFKAFKLKLREAPDENANGTTVNVPKNTVLRSEYTANQYESYYYATIQGQSGWYSQEDAYKGCAYKLYDYYHGYDNKNDSSTPAPIYSDIVTQQKQVGKIPAGSLFKPLYYGDYEVKIGEDEGDWVYFYYVRYNDVTGWVLEEDLREPFVEEETTEPEEEEDEYEEWEEEETWDEEEWVEDEADEWDEDSTIDFTPDSLLQQRQRSPLQIVLICVGGAVVLALTAAVTLLLVRRKRKAKSAPEDAQ